MKTGFCFLAMIIAMGQKTFAQSACSSPEASQFDFWIGEWELSWNDTLHGINSITKEMNDCVVHEHFNDPKNKYSGSSWSVYNVQTHQWQQTWVDNSGGYIVLTGGMNGNRMVLTTSESKTNTGSIIHQMIFYNISHNAFDWNWEASADQGKTWEVKWKIHYHRKNE